MIAATEQQREQIARQVQAAYELGASPQLQLILNQQQPDSIARLLDDFGYFLSARVQKISRYTASVQRLNQLDTEIQQGVEDLRAEQADVQRQYIELLRERELREHAVVQLRQLMRNKDDRLKQQEHSRRALERVVTAVKTITSRLTTPVDSKSPFVQMRGHLPWPLSGRVVNRFGTARSGSVLWDGVLIAAANGTPVHAIHNGRVMFADWLPGQGMLMIVDHGNGYMSVYAHNEVLLKEPGDWVQAGDTIARSGDTGGEDNAGLYFELRYQGKPVDPMVWCKRG